MFDAKHQIPGSLLSVYLYKTIIIQANAVN